MSRDHLRGYGLPRRTGQHNHPSPAFQYRTQRRIPVRLKPLDAQQTDVVFGRRRPLYVAHDAHGFDRDEPFRDQLVDGGQKRVHLLFRIDDLDHDRQVG